MNYIMKLKYLNVWTGGQDKILINGKKVWKLVMMILNSSVCEP